MGWDINSLLAIPQIIKILKKYDSNDVVYVKCKGCVEESSLNSLHRDHFIVFDTITYSKLFVFMVLFWIGIMRGGTSLLKQGEPMCSLSHQQCHDHGVNHHGYDIPQIKFMIQHHFNPAPTYAGALLGIRYCECNLSPTPGILGTLRYGIIVQVGINVQVGISL